MKYTDYGKSTIQPQDSRVLRKVAKSWSNFLPCIICGKINKIKNTKEQINSPISLIGRAGKSKELTQIHISIGALTSYGILNVSFF